MPVNMTKTRKAPGRKKTGTKGGLTLPATTSFIEIGGTEYFIAPSADMAEWLEDLEDIVDSIVAMKESGEAIPWEEAKKTLGLTKAPARRTAAKSKARK